MRLMMIKSIMLLLAKEKKFILTLTDGALLLGIG